MSIAIYARVSTRLGGESQPGGRSTSVRQSNHPEICSDSLEEVEPA
jgi:hypothetical protein